MAESIKITLELDDRQYASKILTAISDTKKLGTESQQASDKAASSFNKLANTADDVIGKLKGLAAAYVGLSAIAGAFRLADELSDLSKATDISIQKILALQGALQSAGGNGEDAGRMISQLVNTLDSARQGSADAQYQFLRLNLSFKDMANLTPEQALNKTIEALAKMTNRTEQQALAFQLFGKSARNLNLEEVNQKLKDSEGQFDAAAAAAKRAADVFDRYEAASKALKIALMESLDPLIEMIGYFDKLAGGGQGGFALTAFKTIFQTVAVLAANIAFVIKTIVDDVGALFQAGKQAVSGNFSAAGDILKNRAAEAKTYREELDKLESRIFQGSSAGGDGKRMGAAADSRSMLFKPSTGNNAPPVQNALSGQIGAVTQLGDAYARANEKARQKIQTDYDLVGSSDEYKKILEETNRITNEAADKISSLQDKLKNLTPQQQAFGVGKAINETIKAIEKDRDASIKAVSDIIVKNEDRIRSITNMKNAYEAMSSAAAAGNEQLFAAQTKLKDAEDARAQALMGPTAKALDQIRIEEEKIADAARKRELATGKYTNVEGDFTNQAAFNQAIDNINKQRDAAIKARTEQKKATDSEQNSFTYGWNDAFKSYAENANNAAQQARSTFTTFTKGLEDVIVNFVTTGKLSFKDLATSLIAEFARIQTRKMLAGLFGGDAPTGGGGGGGFNIGSFFSSIFGGLFGKAGGGSVMAGHPYMVGEAGKELFIPKSAGTIVPNGALAGAGGGSVVNNYYSISAVDAKSVAQLFAENRMTMLGTIRQAEKELPFGRGR